MVCARTMFLSYFLVVTLAVFGVSNSEPYNLRSLLPSYNLGVNNFNSILRALNGLDGSSESVSGQFFKNIEQYATNSLNGFTQCSNLATTKSGEMAAEEVGLLAELSKEQESLRLRQKESASQQRKVASAKSQLKTQTDRLHSAQQSLSSTQSALRSAQKKVDDAKKCFRVRRKRGFGSFFKKVRKAVSKPFKQVERAVRKPVKKIIKIHEEVLTFPLRQANRACASLLNKLTGALKDARKARDQAQATVTTQQTRVNTARSQLSGVEAKLKQLNQAKAVLEAQIRASNTKITSQRAQHQKVVKLKDQLRIVQTHLSAVKAPIGPSVEAMRASQKIALLDKVEGLLSLESVIGQLEDVAKGLRGSLGGVPKFMETSPADKLRIKNQIIAFKLKLQHWAQDIDSDSEVDDFD